MDIDSLDELSRAMLEAFWAVGAAESDRIGKGLRALIQGHDLGMTLTNLPCAMVELFTPEEPSERNMERTNSPMPWSRPPLASADFLGDS